MAFVDTEKRSAGEVQQKVGRIKLSEAIRIGAKIRPQCKGSYLYGGKSCAFGAALEAVFGLTEKTWNTDEHKRAIEYFGCDSLEGEITARNDSGESRESIAAWLESQGL